MSNSWFRMYNEVVDDPKVQRLPLLLFRAWINCLCLASANAGRLPEIDDIAYKLRITKPRAESIIEELIGLELLERDGDVVTPHNWHTRQFNVTGSAERMRRHRDKQRERHSDGNSDATALRYTETEQIQNRTEDPLNPPQW